MTRHDASLTCVSCDPTGARPVGVLDTEESGEGLGLLVDRRKVWVGHWLAGNIPGWTAQNLTSALFQSRYLSDNGRLFFNSPDEPRAAGEQPQGERLRVRARGLGSCESASGGCVSLISSGDSEQGIGVPGSHPDGSDVFFVTAAQLLPQDTDTAFDIYDARVCTQASPCLTPPTPASSLRQRTEACRPAPSLRAGTARAVGARAHCGPG